MFILDSIHDMLGSCNTSHALHGLYEVWYIPEAMASATRPFSAFWTSEVFSFSRILVYVTLTCGIEEREREKLHYVHSAGAGWTILPWIGARKLVQLVAPFSKIDTILITSLWSLA